MAARSSFRTRVTLVFAALLAMVLLAAFAAIYKLILDSTYGQIQAQLRYSRHALEHQLAERMNGLRDATQILARDFGFRKAVATGDVPTIKSVSDNFSGRTDGSRIMVADPQGALLADTATAATTRRLTDKDKLRVALEHGVVIGTMTLEGTIYQTAMAPVLAPDPVGYLIVAKPIDDELLHSLRKRLPGDLDLSFVAADAGRGRALITSTLPESRRGALMRAFATQPLPDADPLRTKLDGVGYMLLAHEVRAHEQPTELPITVILQYSIDVALAPFKPLYLTLLWIFAGGLLFGVLGAFGVSRSVTRPLLALVDATQRIQAGEYDRPVAMHKRDEFGQLADAFDLMMTGIAEREERIRHQAQYDTLTELPNRIFLDGRLAELGDAENGTCAALLVCVERFGEINGTLGHEVGDQLMRILARKLTGAVKASDTVARIASDTFAVIAPGAGVSDVAPMAERLLALFEAPFRIDGVTIDVGAHIGAACYPTHTDDARTLLRRADRAVFAARESIARYALYDPRSDTSNRIRLSLMSELRDAISSDGFALHYQPQVAIDQNRLLRVEALIRWDHPDLGRLAPDQFIPLAERTGDIHRLTRWVLDRAIRQLAEWSRHNLRIGMSVNLSAKDLNDQHLPIELGELLARHGVSPDRLVVEITESALMRQPEQVITVLRAFREMGVGVAIDDFGTGYSSLAYLSRFPVSELKIDKAFVMGMQNNAHDASIVHAVIDLGHRLSLSVVAEGVEDAAALERLGALGCDLAQGYGIGRPMPAADLEAWIARSAAAEPDTAQPRLVADVRT